MFDRGGIYTRYIESQDVSGITELASILGVTYQNIHSWKTGRNAVPWSRLKALADEKNLRWDWLIEGRGPKLRRRCKGEECRPLDCHSINQRFLALFPADISQVKLGKELGVNGTTVFKWRKGMEKVSWERLRWAVETKGVTWEWLLEGRGKGPVKNRERRIKDM